MMFKRLSRFLERRSPDVRPAEDPPTEVPDDQEPPIEQVQSEVASAPPLDAIQQLRALSSQREWREMQACGFAMLASSQADDILALLAYGLQQQGCLVEAARLAFTATEINANLWLAQFVAGVCFQGLGQVDEACRHLRVALDLNPTDAQTLRRFVESVAEVRGVDEAATLYRNHCATVGIAAEVLVAPIRGVREWAFETGAPVLATGEVEAIPFKSPEIWGEPFSQRTVTALSDAPYVADLADVRIFGNSGIIVTSDGTALSDLGAHPRFGCHVKYAYEHPVLFRYSGRLLLDLGSYVTREIECGMWLAGLASNAFGHWLPDFLPRLQFLMEHPSFPELPLIVDADMPQSHFDHLRRLTENPLIALRRDESFRCKRLLVASAPTFLSVDIMPGDIPISDMPGLSPRALRFVRGKDGPDGSGAGDRRIFLARRKCQWRRLLNELEIAEALVALGFETVFVEEMSVREQIALFRGAAWIVAPNGSALLNLIFADPGVKVLMLSQPDLFNWGTFQGPMESLGYRPQWACGERLSGPNPRHADYVVPVDRILTALRGMGFPDSQADRKNEAEGGIARA